MQNGRKGSNEPKSRQQQNVNCYLQAFINFTNPVKDLDCEESFMAPYNTVCFKTINFSTAAHKTNAFNQ